LQSFKEIDRDLIKKTLIILALGGDGSRWNLGYFKKQFIDSNNNNRAPMWFKESSAFIEPLYTVRFDPPIFFDFALQNILFIQEHYQTQIPIALITGPNTHRLVEKYISHHYLINDFNYRLIQQDGKIVYSTDGEPILWENQQPLMAPTGTAGILEALGNSKWKADLVKQGYEYGFIWNINALEAGKALSLVELLANNPETIITTALIPQVKALLSKLKDKFSHEKDYHDYLELEDLLVRYAFRINYIDDILSVVEVHVVKKEIPIAHNGVFLKANKVEKFLSDAIRKFALLSIKASKPHLFNLKPGEIIKLKNTTLEIKHIDSTKEYPIWYCIDKKTGKKLCLDITMLFEK